MEFNVLGLSMESLLTILIILFVIQCTGIIKCAARHICKKCKKYKKMETEGLAPWDTFDVRFQQERDDAIGATPAGDSEREKQYARSGKTEGLTGGYGSPEFTSGIDKELPPKGEADIDRTENSLEHSLHGD